MQSGIEDISFEHARFANVEVINLLNMKISGSFDRIVNVNEFAELQNLLLSLHHGSKNTCCEPGRVRSN